MIEAWGMARKNLSGEEMCSKGGDARYHQEANENGQVEEMNRQCCGWIGNC